MLVTSLNTNEVKNAAGTEVEFSRWLTEGRKVVYAQVAETLNLPHRVTISHADTGTGSSAVRRSVVRVDKTIAGADTTPVVCSAYLVTVVPSGNLSATTEPKNVLAELLSLCASAGASTTILYDCSGTGAVPLIDGSL